MGPMHPLDQILQRAFSQISAEAFITDFVRQAIEANRYRGNPPASQFGIDHLKEETTLEACSEACTVCQDVMEQGAVTLTMPCGHGFHKDCLMPWLQEHNTCPVCRCEIESHCPRYNQQNFDKLKGELDKETISRHKTGDLPSDAESGRGHAPGRRQADGQPLEPGLMAGASGTRSLRMTFRMPAGALSALVTRMSSAGPQHLGPQDGEQLSHPPRSDALPRSSAPATPPRPSLAQARAQARVLPHPSVGGFSSLGERLGFIPASIPASSRRLDRQPASSATSAMAPRSAESGGAVLAVHAAVGPSSTPSEAPSPRGECASRRQTVRSRRRTREESNEAPTGASVDETPGSDRKRERTYKRPRTTGPGALEAGSPQQGASSAPCDAAQLPAPRVTAPSTEPDAPVSSRTRKRQ